MTDMPERIWAWRFMVGQRNEHMQGGWDDKEDPRETPYVRADLLPAEPEDAAPVAWRWDDGRYSQGWDTKYSDAEPAPHLLVNDVTPLYAEPPDTAALRAQIATLTAERDAAVGAAYQAAAYEVRGSNLGLDINDIADDVSALIPADALSALDRIKQEAWNEGIEAAAGELAHHLTTPEDATLSQIWQERILALRKEGR